MKKLIFIAFAFIVVLVIFSSKPKDDSSPSAPQSSAKDGGVEDLHEISGFELSAPEEKSKIFDITARNFSFSQGSIRVNKDDLVQINFTSQEGTHDWVVDEFGAMTEQVGEGFSSIVIFTADKAGEFEYYCSVGNHRELGMKGILVVEE